MKGKKYKAREEQRGIEGEMRRGRTAGSSFECIARRKHG